MCLIINNGLGLVVGAEQIELNSSIEELRNGRWLKLMYDIYVDCRQHRLKQRHDHLQD